MPSASHFSASEIEGDRSYRASAFITCEKAFLVPANGVRHHTAFEGGEEFFCKDRLQLSPLDRKETVIDLCPRGQHCPTGILSDQGAGEPQQRDTNNQ